MVRPVQEEASTSGTVRLAPCSCVPALTRIGYMKILAGRAETYGCGWSQVTTPGGSTPRFAGIPLIRLVVILQDGRLLLKVT
jgi:hypothetical protein